MAGVSGLGGIEGDTFSSFVVAGVFPHHGEGSKAEGVDYSHL
ncbi:hypothetical protein ACIRU5_14700 [Streptomyces misionensis]